MYEYGSKIVGSNGKTRWGSYKSPYLLAELDEYEYRSPYKQIWAQQGRQLALHQKTRLNDMWTDDEEKSIREAGITGSATARAGDPNASANGVGAKVTPPAQPQAPAASSTLSTAMLVGLGIGAVALVVALLRK